MSYRVVSSTRRYEKPPREDVHAELRELLARGETVLETDTNVPSSTLSQRAYKLKCLGYKLHTHKVIDGMVIWAERPH